MITGPLKCPICQNGGSITRSLHGHFNQLASDVDRGMSPLATFVPCDTAPVLRQHPLPWSATLERKMDEESPSTSRRQARAVSGLRSQESPRSARTAREQ